jgi:hypothetical protein
VRSSYEPAPLVAATISRHKLVDVVVEAVVKAVDVAQPPVPTHPLTVANTTLGEARHPHDIGEQTVAEVEILYLYPMLTCCHAINDVLVLTDGGKGGIVLDPAQQLRYTGGVHKPNSLWAGLRGVPPPPGPFLYPTSLSYHIITINV